MPLGGSGNLWFPHPAHRGTSRWTRVPCVMTYGRLFSQSSEGDRDSFHAARPIPQIGKRKWKCKGGHPENCRAVGLAAHLLQKWRTAPPGVYIS